MSVMKIKHTSFKSLIILFSFLVTALVGGCFSQKTEREFGGVKLSFIDA